MTDDQKCPRCGAGLVIFADCKPRNQCITGLQCVDKCGYEVPMTEVLAAAEARIVADEAEAAIAARDTRIAELEAEQDDAVANALTATNKQIARKKAMNTKHLPLSEAEWEEGIDRAIGRRLVEEGIGRAELRKLIRELVEEEGLMPSGAFAKLAEKPGPRPTAPEGFEFLLDDEGRQVKRPPKKGERYFLEGSIGNKVALADRDWGMIAFPILRKLDPPNPKPKLAAGDWVEAWPRPHILGPCLVREAHSDGGCLVQDAAGNVSSEHSFQLTKLSAEELGRQAAKFNNPLLGNLLIRLSKSS